MAKEFHQMPSLDFLDAFSPVIKASTIIIIFSIPISCVWQIEQLDINNAFLNGDLVKMVFMTQLEGFVDSSRPTHVCRLYKSLYSLKQAPRS